MAANNDDKSFKAPSGELSNLPGTVSRGLKVLFSELKWQLVWAIRSLEVRQMNKRLRREYQSLGEASYESVRQTPEGESLPPADSKMIMAVKQIEFLKDEIDHLGREGKRMRKEFVVGRSKDLGFE